MFRLDLELRMQHSAGISAINVCMVEVCFGQPVDLWLEYSNNLNSIGTVVRNDWTTNPSQPLRNF
jgi:hypothetical protein